jgi:ribA/ribD-fused uncharacterized protein
MKIEHDVIDSFQGSYRWLSNFEKVEITMPDGITYPSIEHAFQAHKVIDLEARQNIANLSTPKDAKKLGRHLKLREDWEEVKFDVMLTALRLKFQTPWLREMLLQTGHAELVEGNTWGDTVWGVCNGVGKNHLGRLLMKVRRELQKKPSEDLFPCDQNQDGPAFFKVLDISTGHLTQEDAQRLDDGECPLPFNTTKYGWIVYCRGNSEEGVYTEGMSKAFAKVMAWARGVKADYVWFDRDGTTYSNLETFEW